MMYDAVDNRLLLMPESTVRQKLLFIFITGETTSISTADCVVTTGRYSLRRISPDVLIITRISLRKLSLNLSSTCISATKEPALSHSGSSCVCAGTRRNISSLFSVLRRHGLARIMLPDPKYVPKPYVKMRYLGQRMQINVKYVQETCMCGKVPDRKYYRYTALDKCTRFRYLGAFDDLSTYNSTLFLKDMLAFLRFKVECVQTDNEFEFTNRFTATNEGKLSLFEKVLAAYGIRHKLIRQLIPRHNGKVERSHRKDNEYFYATHKFCL